MSFEYTAHYSIFQSTRPVWGATAILSRLAKPTKISIHAPRVGRDAIARHFAGLLYAISIHAPRVGRDGKI